MNVKQGDLAIVIRDGRGMKLAGRIVEVVSPAGTTSFTLPDGYSHEACPVGWWVVRFEGSPIDAPCSYGRARKTHFGAAPDSALRPISGLQDDETADTDQTIKIEETA